MAFKEAEHKARIILERNLATHSFFPRDLKPPLFTITDALRSRDYFEPAWMSSTFAIRRIDEYFNALSDENYYYKECAVNARSPRNEADAYEREFIQRLNSRQELQI